MSVIQHVPVDKRFLSQKIDTYRKSYGKDARPYPRHCVIIGTTNESDYLRDLTGNRRIWPVQVGQIDLDGFTTAVDQLWAEAVVAEASGEGLTLPATLWDLAAALQNRRMAEDPYADILVSGLQDRKGKVSMESIKQLLGIQPGRALTQDARRIRAIMADIGWEYATLRLFDLSGADREPRKGFARGSVEERKVEYWARRAPNGACFLEVIPDQHVARSPF